MAMSDDQVPVELGIEGIGEATRIGEGGFGIVYRARQEAFGRNVAVKVLRAPALDEEARRRFDHECQAIGSMSRHPHIVAVYTAGTSAYGQPYLVMEHLPRGTLAERLAREGPLAPDEVIEIGIKLADALGAAHAAGVLHRDLKPENVLISGYGEPQLVDFGVARIQGGTATRSGIVTGTLAHAAPEVLSGQRASEASDVYSLASTLYALLAGQAPFVRSGEETFHPLLARVLGEDAPDLRPAGVPPALWGVLEAALAKDPTQRTSSASALAEELEAARGTPGVRRAHRVAPVTATGSPPGPASVRASAPGSGTEAISGAWARPAPAPPPPPPSGPNNLAERLGSMGKPGLIGAAAVLAVAVVLGALVFVGGGDSSKPIELSSSDEAVSTTIGEEAAADPVPPPEDEEAVDQAEALPEGADPSSAPATTAAPAGAAPSGSQRTPPGGETASPRSEQPERPEPPQDPKPPEESQRLAPPDRPDQPGLPAAPPPPRPEDAPTSDRFPCDSGQQTEANHKVQYCPLWRANVPVYDSPDKGNGARQIDTLYVGGKANWFVGQSYRSNHTFESYNNRWWAFTLGDNNKWGWVPQVFFQGGNNNERDAGLATCDTRGNSCSP